ncbi:MAG: methyltransferase domain-containing protein [Sphingomonadales bacterium]|nr:methyltransferase domain-containing protein [Sphingomonadales bacterium]
MPTLTTIFIKPLMNRFRRRRFRFFLACINDLPRPLTILDIGGTEAYWNQVGLSAQGIQVILLNLTEVPVVNANQFRSVSGTATDLSSWSDQSVDLIFSNSVIEHLFNWSQQQKMAQEVQRVGKSFFIQTPNYYFPIEPHWLFPFFQFLPRAWRIALTRLASWGHMPACTTIEEASLLVDEVRLLTPSEMKTLFLGASLYKERWCGLVKSISAYFILR